MDGIDSNPPAMLAMNSNIEPQLASTEGALMLQGVVTDRQYMSPEMALQSRQGLGLGVHATGATTTTAANPASMVTLLASSPVETVVTRVTELEMSGQTAQAQEDAISLRAQLSEMSAAVLDMERDCQLPVTGSLAGAPGGQEAGDAFHQGADGVGCNSFTEQGDVVDAAPNQVQAADRSEAIDVIIQVNQVQDRELAPSMDEAQGNPQMERPSRGVDDQMETGIQQEQDACRSPENGTGPSADAASQQGTVTDDRENDAESQEVIFVCIHGQSFRCRPQAGIPVDSPVDSPMKEPPTDACACSKSKKPLPNAGIVRGGKLARKLRSRKQLFTCDKCGGRFSQKAALDLHMDAHEDEDELEEETVYFKEVDVEAKSEGARRKTKRGRLSKRISPRKQGTANETCPDCGKVFSGLKALAVHKRRHEREKKQEEPEDGENVKQKDGKARNLSCTVCQKKFTRMYDVERHMETHVDGDRKKCSGCGKEFHTIKSRERHESLHCEVKRQNKCGTCQLVLGSKFKLLRHEREHLTTEQISNLSCKDCAKVFTNTRSLLRHEKLHLKEKGALINCTSCPETFEDRFTYNVHRKTHAVKAYQCELCNMKFKHEYLLNIHMKRKTCQKKRESLRDVECNICHKVVKGTATLKRHMRTHTKEKPYPCRIGCNSSFSSTSNRLSHERMYCKLSPDYLCTHCGEVLSNQSKLIYHESKYHGIGPIVGGQRTANTEFPCRHCGKVFFFKGGRKRHERIHTNEKPFMCQYCPKAFVHASALVCHERVHTNERPYICEECGKAFSQATHLKTHIRVHTKEKPYKCKHCDKAFSHMGTRKSHEGTHKNNPNAGMQAAAAQGQVPAKFHLPQQVEHHVVLHPEIKVVHQGAEPVLHKIHASHHEHEVQAADVILQLLESGSRVPNFEGLVNMASS